MVTGPSTVISVAKVDLMAIPRINTSLPRKPEMKLTCDTEAIVEDEVLLLSWL